MLKRKKDVQVAVEETTYQQPEDTLERIEAVTDRLEWLAQQLEEELRTRGGSAE